MDVLKGIGPAYAERLGDADVYTVGDLRDADAAELAAATDLSETRVSRWIERANDYCTT
ncbi:helix-hairpin-helix domain-containing protein [Haloplanus sp. GCM10025708]|uniref:helix-hairpin-helix domain-containing protein n=1 Tax=Haloplanus sp. GCM10025708 TaxID=3252679 RepID=UPI003614C1EC